MSLDANDLTAIRNIFTEVFNDGFEALIRPQFDYIYARLDALEARLGKVEECLDGVESRLDKIEARLDENERATKELRNEVRAGFGMVNRRLIILEGKVEALENDVKELYQMAA
ncbi:MAG: hypothetical protein WA843_03945 [Candidatus Saccharimonadales bacterium]